MSIREVSDHKVSDRSECPSSEYPSGKRGQWHQGESRGVTFHLLAAPFFRE